MAGPAQLIVVTGPTASGKTEVALKLADRLPVEVISADSMQVYRGMDVATAKPDANEQLKLPHHLIDIRDPDQEYSAGAFAADARACEDSIRARGGLPLILGGTGLYIKARLHGLAGLPDRQDCLRHELEGLCRALGPEKLWRWLERLDAPAAERISRNDPVRIVRYLEIIFTSGRTVTSQHRGFGERQTRALVLAIVPERETLYRRIDARAAAMFASGLIDETEELLRSGYDEKLRSMQTLAYKHVIRLIRGEINQNEAIALVQADTRHYAKRQLTWLKSNPPDEIYPTPQAAHERLERLLGSELPFRAKQC